ncbi:HAD family hydrolase [uncultured Actinomyces sp.]|uniref:HAD family hydrolase n=1 Tax=uncultured Actinomyces sp. TaxID=249061 RepID=UPI0028EAB592|nr:HAD family hydrolase [uncultured Actinomyces sp.]
MVRAAFFDLDKTILDTSSNVALSGPFIEAGLMTRRTAIASVLVQLPYLLAGADESRMEQMAEAMGRMGRGWNAAFLEATVEDALERTIEPVCYAQALQRIAYHKSIGDVVVIASASVEQVVRPIATMRGAAEALASQASVDDAGCFRGAVTHSTPAPGKADACEQLARTRGWDLSQCSAYSDSVSDAPLLRLVGHPYAVNPDRALREMAEREGWPTLTFSSTVRVLPRRVPTPAKVAVPFVVGVAVGAAACALARR